MNILFEVQNLFGNVAQRLSYEQ